MATDDQAGGDADHGMTVGELAAATGTTVRTIRWYTTRGLLPSPTRHGRKAYYSREHVARLELVQALQDHGFSLADIEAWLERQGPDARVRDLVVERAMLTSWHPRTEVAPDRAALSRRAGRTLSDHDLALLEANNAVARHPDGWEVLPAFDVGVRLLELDIPIDGVAAASAAIRRHMVALADELTTVLRDRVVVPHRASDPTPEQSRAFGEAMATLRELTLEAIVLQFQRAANEVVRDALDREDLDVREPADGQRADSA